MREFTFNYLVPPADTLTQETHIITVTCKGWYNEDKQPQIVVISTTFPLLTAFELVSPNATMVKLLESAKQYFVNWTNNAKPSLMSEQEVNDIFNLNNQN